jgi:Transposase domain (DUF772)
MRPKERRDSGQNDLFRARLDQIVDLGHPLAKLALTIDWRFLEERFGAVYSDKPGQPPLPTRLMAGLAILKHTHNLSDEELCARWVENPYYQLFCGEEFFRHKPPFDRSSLTRWRQRMGEEELVALIQESLSAATRTGAAKPSDFSKVIIDTTVQPKAVAFATDARLMHRARERLVRLARKHLPGSTASGSPTSATPTPSSSSAPTGRCAACAPISAGCFRTSSARPGTMRSCARSSPSRCRWPSGCAISARTSAGEKACPRAPSRGSIRCSSRGRMHRQGQSASPL